MKEIVIESIAGLFFIIVISVFLLMGLISFGKSQTKSSCVRFAAETGYETKYAEYTYFRFNCLAKQSDGKWISTENIYANTQNK